MMLVSVDAGATFTAGMPRVLFEAPYLFGPVGRGNPNYDVAADRRFLMVQGAATGESPRLHVVLNWFEELKRLQP